jgi:ribosomal-protein-alanine N-acetyltransferase
MQITAMTEALVPKVSALEALCFSTPWSENSIRSELENPYSIWLVALEETELAGYLGVQFGPDGGDIMTIATDPAYRGQGVGRLLLTTMTGLLREKQLGYLTLEVRPSNEPALKLYEAFGFRQVGRRPNYYKNPREDALLLTKFFEEGPESC